MNWNNKNPDEALDPIFTTPNYLEINGKKHVLTLAERGYYIKARGDAYAVLLDSNKKGLQVPDKNSIDILKNLRTSARGNAKYKTIRFIMDKNK
jgi:hypothetical protein